MAGNETHYTLPRPAFDAPVKLLIVVAPYYKDIADNLLAGAIATLEAVGATHQVVEVPGVGHAPMLLDEAQIGEVRGFLLAE